MMAWLRACWYRLFRDPDVDPPEAAEAPDPVVTHAERAIEQPQQRSISDMIRQAIDCGPLREGDKTVLRNNDLLLNDAERDALDAAFTAVVRATYPVPYVARHSKED